MSTESLIGRMLNAVDEYEAGHMLPEQLERVIKSHMEGLERIGLRQIHDSRGLAARLVNAHLIDGSEEFIDAEKVQVVISDLRQFLKSLRDSKDTEPKTPGGSKTPPGAVE